MSNDKAIGLALTGAMDKDSDPRYVNGGNYRDARNIQSLGDRGGDKGSKAPTYGNELAENLGSVQAQDKIYRLTFSGDATKVHEIRMLSTNRDGSIVNGSGPNGGIAFNGTQSDFVTQWNASNTGNASISLPTPTTAEVRLLSYNYYQFYLESTGVDDVEVICIQEAIPVDLAGPLKNIGSYDLLGDLFVFSTTQDNEPTELDVQVISVGPINAGVYTGPLTFLTFNQPHGFVAGQWIRITNSQAPWLNGLFVVRQINSTTQIGIPTVLAWGGTRPLVTSFTEVIRINPTGIGEIGVAQKDDNSDSWNYIRLLRSVELNFVSKYAIDCFGVRKTRNIAVYYTDNLNLPRVFYYYGRYGIWGAFNHVSENNIYNLDNVSNESSLQLETSPAIIRFVGQDRNGGNLLCGVKYYSVRQYNNEFNSSIPSKLDGPVIVFKPNPITSPTGLITYGYEVSGYSTTDPTTVRNHLEIQGLDALSFAEAEIICVESISGVIVANSIHRFNIPSDGNYDYYHTGFEDRSPIDVGEMFVSDIKSASGIIKAKNIRSIDSRNILSNITTVEDLDLHQWAKSIKHELFMDEIDESTLSETGEMQSPTVVYDDLGLMLNETYRMSTRVFLRGIGWTSWYWIDDIKIDTNPINTSNPNGDNRRVGTFPSFELSNGEYAPLSNTEISDQGFIRNGNVWDQSNVPIPNSFIGTQIGENDILTVLAAGITPTEGWVPYFNSSSDKYSQNAKYKVPKVKFHIDWNHYSNNIISQDLYRMVSAVEFAIGDIGNSVKASGLGVAGVSSNSRFFPNSTDSWDVKINNGNIFEFPFCPYRTLNTQSPYLNPNGNIPVFTPLVPNYPIINYGGGSHVGPDKPTFANQRRDYMSFYSPDHIIECSAENPSGGNGLISNVDKVVILGDYMTYKLINGSPAYAFDDALAGNYTRGDFSLLHPQGDDFHQAQEINIATEGIAFVKDTNPAVEFPNGDIFERKDSIYFWEEDPARINWPEYDTLNIRFDLPVFKLNSNIDFSNEFQNDRRKQSRGLVYCQLMKDTLPERPSLNNTNYTKIGHTVFFESFPNNEIIVNGGDTATTLFHFKQRGFSFQENLSTSDLRFFNSSMLGIVCQTRRNIKALNPFELDFPLRLLYPPSYFGNTDPSINQSETVTFFEEKKALAYWSYPASSGPLTGPLATGWWNGKNNELEILSDYEYGIIRLLTSSPPAQINLDTDTKENAHPNRIAWSESNATSSLKDFYRVFMPLSIKDIDLSFGGISHHEDIGGELFTVQPRKFQLQYFNARGILEASNSSVDILLGEASVLSRDGQTLSSYGTQHKWSAIKGLSQSGKDVLYWFNQENGLIMRFGADGTGVLSSIRNMSMFFTDYTKWTKDKHEHAFEQGIRGVWDDKRKEAIWTFTGWRTINQAWRTGTIVEVGEIVTNDHAPLDTFEGFPRFFRCIQVHQSSALTEPGVGADWQQYWEQIPYTDPEYYSIFTIAYNELVSGFTTFYDHLPKTYLRWKNTFLSSHPVERNLLYEHRRGLPTTWYEWNGLSKQEDATIEGVLNIFPEDSKKFFAIQALTKNVPDRIEFRTPNNYTWLTDVDFVENDDQFRSSIKQDATVSGNPDSDTEPMRGDYMLTKLFFTKGTYNVLYRMVIKIRGMFRLKQD